MINELTSDQKAMARTWLGYGRWEAPFWFIGMEPGGVELERSVERWVALGCHELLDISEHHAGGMYEWFSEKPKTQPTWSKLILLLLTYLGKDATKETILAFQRASFGRPTSDVLSMNISALATPKMSSPQERMLYRAERVERIKAQLTLCKPEIVVFYGYDKQCMQAWEAIIGKPIEKGKAARKNGVKYLIAPHPNEWRKGRANATWKNFGRDLASC